MIAIVNYGSGNIQAIANIYHRLGIPHRIASAPADLADADRCILPGVGAFDQCMTQLIASGMCDALHAYVQEGRRPILGICVGMQVLARGSEEGAVQGLGWIDATVKRFDVARFDQATRLPHMGWNTVELRRSNRLFEGVDLAQGFYFLHSYHFVCTDDADVLGVTEYGGPFTAAVQRGLVFGAQFHPEKSHGAGVQVLKNFSTL